jgi:hypothetical protein
VQWVGYSPDESTWEPEENLHKNEVARYLKSVQLPSLSGELFVATFREHVYRHLKPKKAASWCVEFYIEELRHPALALCVMNAIRGDVPLAHVTCSQRDKTTLTLRAGSTGMNSLGHAFTAAWNVFASKMPCIAVSPSHSVSPSHLNIRSARATSSQMSLLEYLER